MLWSSDLVLYQLEEKMQQIKVGWGVPRPTFGLNLCVTNIYQIGISPLERTFLYQPRNLFLGNVSR